MDYHGALSGSYLYWGLSNLHISNSFSKCKTKKIPYLNLQRWQKKSTLHGFSKNAAVENLRQTKINKLWKKELVNLEHFLTSIEPKLLSWKPDIFKTQAVPKQILLVGNGVT